MLLVDGMKETEGEKRTCDKIEAQSGELIDHLKNVKRGHTPGDKIRNYGKSLFGLQRSENDFRTRHKVASIDAVQSGQLGLDGITHNGTRAVSSSATNRWSSDDIARHISLS
jgi:hypothetical protein